MFMIVNESWSSAVPAVQARGPMKREPARSLGQTFVRLAGHADVRWHLWIVLAALGQLDAALVVYAAYFPARALAGALRKAARHG
jgi:hypothetical protein